MSDLLDVSGFSAEASAEEMSDIELLTSLRGYVAVARDDKVLDGMGPATVELLYDMIDVMWDEVKRRVGGEGAECPHCGGTDWEVGWNFTYPCVECGWVAGDGFREEIEASREDMIEEMLADSSAD